MSALTLQNYFGPSSSIDNSYIKIYIGDLGLSTTSPYSADQLCAAIFKTVQHALDSDGTDIPGISVRNAGKSISNRNNVSVVGYSQVWTEWVADPSADNLDPTKVV